jgi:tRNA-splicing endonuclease subunit Sen34
VSNRSIHPHYRGSYRTFNPDAAVLRVQHRICGLTTGTLPGVSQQNVFLGLPLVMMPEEVVLLVEESTSIPICNVTTAKIPLVH